MTANNCQLTNTFIFYYPLFLTSYHHTISSTLLYGLREALAEFIEEGYNNVIARHRNCAQQLYEGLAELCMQLYIQDVTTRLPTVTTVHVPEHINWREIIDYTMKQ